MERRCDFFVLSCWPPLQNPRAVELTEAIFFALSTKSWALFFFVFSGEAAKAKGGGAIATNEGQKAEYYAEATADVLRWSGKYAAAEKKRLVFSSFFLSFFGLSTWIMICSKPLRDFSGEVEEQGGRRALMIRWYQTEGEKEEKRKESLFPFWLSDDLLHSFFFYF